MSHSVTTSMCALLLVLNLCGIFAEAKKIDVVRPKREVLGSDPRVKQPDLPSASQQSAQGDPSVEPCASTHYRPQLKKPKSLKVMTSYDMCKQECRKMRDQQSTKEYVAQLREELQIAEEHERLMEQQQSEKEVTLNSNPDSF